MKNPVDKHARTFNKSVVYTDKKKRKKRGYNKHAKNLKAVSVDGF
jgi:hypothetical protein